MERLAEHDAMQAQAASRWALVQLRQQGAAPPPEPGYHPTRSDTCSLR
jgi:hypothetical protein